MHNRAYTKEDESTLALKDPEWIKKEARSLETMRSIGLHMAIPSMAGVHLSGVISWDSAAGVDEGRPSKG